MKHTKKYINENTRVKRYGFNTYTFAFTFKLNGRKLFFERTKEGDLFVVDDDWITARLDQNYANKKQFVDIVHDYIWDQFMDNFGLALQVKNQ